MFICIHRYVCNWYLDMYPQDWVRVGSKGAIAYYMQKRINSWIGDGKMSIYD